MTTFGEFLKEARRKRGYSQQTVSNYTGITDSRLSRFERDKDKCPPDELRNLSKLYGISIIDLYLKAGYLMADDLQEFKEVFQGVNELDEAEKAHIQQCINMLIRRNNRI